MAIITGENAQALRKISDMARLMSFVVLGLHVLYVYIGYIGVKQFDLGLFKPILNLIAQIPIFRSFLGSKNLALLLLFCSLIGSKGKLDERYTWGGTVKYFILGWLLFYGSMWLYFLPMSPYTVGYLYGIAVFGGFLLFIRSFSHFGRILNEKIFKKDIFNKISQTFPQSEGLISNEYSINLPARYKLREKTRKSWINIINPFRSLLVLGSPGSGKSYFIIRHVISQHLEKGFSMFVYDFKYDDLTKIAYHHWKHSEQQRRMRTRFYCINFEDLSKTHRCNPLEPTAMNDITDASESARIILLGLNREWIRRQGDFFVESAINLLTAVIWYLRCYKNGKYCTLPHVIELMQQEYDILFSLLRSHKEIEVLINPFVNAYINNVMEQLEGQVASAKIALARLSSPQLYYVLSGNDFSLDINNPADPKVVCMGNNPQKIHIYGAVLSLYINRIVKQVNRKGMHKCSLIFDEFPTIFLNNIDSLIATARSNKVATCLSVQDISQLRKDYGKDLADVIMNIVGNIISGQVSGDTAKQLSERFGKIMQDRQSTSVNHDGTSVNYSQQLDYAIPPSTISGLSSGEFVGLVADDPNTPIALKGFHAEIINNHEELKKEEEMFQEMLVINRVSYQTIQDGYLQIKKEIDDMAIEEIERMFNNPELHHLVIPKNQRK